MIYLVLENRALWDNVEEYCRAEQDTNDNLAHALCVLNNLCYKQTLSENITFNCFSTATMVARTRLTVTS